MVTRGALEGPRLLVLAVHRGDTGRGSSGVRGWGGRGGVLGEGGVGGGRGAGSTLLLLLR